MIQISELPFFWSVSMASCYIPLRLSVAFIWLATGIISAFISADQGRELLASPFEIVESRCAGGIRFDQPIDATCR